jgi:hypothetical protein
MGQFSFEYCPMSHKTSSRIYQDQPTLGGWLVTLPLLSAFVLLLTSLSASSSSVRLVCCPSPALSLCCLTCICSLTVQSRSESSAPCATSVLLGRFSVPPSPLLLVLNYSLLFIFFCFVGGQISLPRSCTGLCSQKLGRGVMHGA